MAFLTIPEILKMINRLSLDIKKTENRIQKRYYENAIKDLQKTLEILEAEQCTKN